MWRKTVGAKIEYFFKFNELCHFIQNYFSTIIKNNYTLKLTKDGWASGITNSITVSGDWSTKSNWGGWNIVGIGSSSRVGLGDEDSSGGNGSQSEEDEGSDLYYFKINEFNF